MDDIGAGPSVDVSEGRAMRKDKSASRPSKRKPAQLVDSSDEAPEPEIDERAEKRKDRKAMANAEVRALRGSTASYCRLSAPFATAADNSAQKFAKAMGL